MANQNTMCEVWKVSLIATGIFLILLCKSELIDHYDDDDTFCFTCESLFDAEDVHCMEPFIPYPNLLKKCEPEQNWCIYITAVIKDDPYFLSPQQNILRSCASLVEFRNICRKYSLLASEATTSCKFCKTSACTDYSIEGVRGTNMSSILNVNFWKVFCICMIYSVLL